LTPTGAVLSCAACGVIRSQPSWCQWRDFTDARGCTPVDLFRAKGSAHHQLGPQRAR